MLQLIYGRMPQTLVEIALSGIIPAAALWGCQVAEIGNDPLVVTYSQQENRPLPQELQEGHPAYGNLIALVEQKADSQSLGKAFCSGNLYHNNTVITAAHCVSENYKQDRTKHRDLSTYQIYFGTNLTQSGEQIKAARAVIHPSADLAIIQLEKPAPKSFEPLKILPDINLVRPGDSVAIAGFGTTYVDGSVDDYIQARQGTSTISSVDKDSVFTDFDESTGNREVTCDGDSGSAMIKVFANGPYSVAITRGGGYLWGSCDTDAASFTSLPNLKTWIDQQVLDLTGTSVPTDPAPQQTDGKVDLESDTREICNTDLMRVCAGASGRGGAGCVTKYCEGGQGYNAKTTMRSCLTEPLRECLLTSGHNGGESCIDNPYKGRLLCKYLSGSPLF